MSGEKSKVVGCVSHGSPPKRLKEDVETMIYKIHNFASLEEARGKYILTAAIQAHGYPWKLMVYPRGRSSSPKDVEYVSVFLRYAGDDKEKPAAKLSIRCNTYNLYVLQRIQAKYSRHTYIWEKNSVFWLGRLSQTERRS